jgi:hypothetical protein
MKTSVALFSSLHLSTSMPAAGFTCIADLYGMKKRLPLLSLIVLTLAGLIFGLLWQNLTAGLLLGFGIGLMAMALLRFFIPRREEESKAKPPEAAE